VLSGWTILSVDRRCDASSAQYGLELYITGPGQTEKMHQGGLGRRLMSTMEKSCPTTETLAGWLQGSLAPQERSHLASHLAACDECRRSVAIAATLEAPPAAPVNEILLSRVVAASRPHRVFPFAAAAAAVLAIGLVFSLFSMRAPQTAPPLAAERPAVV